MGISMEKFKVKENPSIKKASEILERGLKNKAILNNHGLLQGSL